MRVNIEIEFIMLNKIVSSMIDIGECCKFGGLTLFTNSLRVKQIWLDGPTTVW